MEAHLNAIDKREKAAEEWRTRSIALGKEYKAALNNPGKDFVIGERVLTRWRRQGEVDAPRDTGKWHPAIVTRLYATPVVDVRYRDGREETETRVDKRYVKADVGGMALLMAKADRARRIIEAADTRPSRAELQRSRPQRRLQMPWPCRGVRMPGSTSCRLPGRVEGV